MEKTTRKLNDLLSQFLSLRNEVSEIADKTADAVFDSVESGDITKEEALTILTDNKLLPVANWICLPDFMDDYDYFSRYSTIYYMDYMYPQNFGFSNSLFDAIYNYDYESKMSVVSEERIREELVKCFKHDTSRTLFALCIVYKSLGDYIFTHTNLWLKPTNEK